MRPAPQACTAWCGICVGRARRPLVRPAAVAIVIGNVVNAALNTLNNGGRYVFFGATLGNPGEGLEMAKIFFRQIRLQGTTMGSPAEFAAMVRGIRTVEQALGTGDKTPVSCEQPIRALVRRSLVIRRDVEAGKVLTSDDLTSKRPGGGISPSELGAVLGRRASRGLRAESVLSWEDLA